ncbi:hypothetical protein [Streptomyces rishiriensis]|uniref:hypothetical protein n=1 Tax=Streptomyces rishiriensis TaxID=68264 RepID=UPI00131F22ED|nr:hypothetical protein [Streptomyces rishiriensis]
MKTYHWSAVVGDGKHNDGEAAGTVRASSEAEARTLIADWVRQDSARKGRDWFATTDDTVTDHEVEEEPCGEGMCQCSCVGLLRPCGCDCWRCPYCQQLPEDCGCEDDC